MFAVPSMKDLELLTKFEEVKCKIFDITISITKSDFLFERYENILFRHILIRRELTQLKTDIGPENHTTYNHYLHHAALPTTTNK